MGLVVGLVVRLVGVGLVRRKILRLIVVEVLPPPLVSIVAVLEVRLVVVPSVAVGVVVVGRTGCTVCRRSLRGSVSLF